MPPVLLSSEGSDRATAYNFSNKILRHDAGLLVSWLDAPATKEGPTRVRLGLCDADDGALRQTQTLGEGIDNHCGASLLTDNSGRVHAFVGAHHGDFLHRWTDDPADERAWSDPEPHGPSHSYPAVVMDTAGTLHLLYRESYRGEGETWQLEYVRRPAGGAWTDPLVIARSPVPGYNHFMHSLSLGPTGALHATLQFHYSDTGNARQGRARLCCHLRSDDAGATWQSEGQLCDLPLTIDSARPILRVPDDGEAAIRIGTHVVDADDRPWLYCAMPEAPFGIMLYRDVAGWQRIDLDEALPGLSFTGGGRSTATTRGPDGRIHLLLSTCARGFGEGWYHPAHELHHIAFSPDGRVADHRQVTADDADNARWLPSVEDWDWRQPERSCSGGHWVEWTDGRNAGWMDAADYEDTLTTKVWLDRLPA
jgi:hypothetical protein